MPNHKSNLKSHPQIISHFSPNQIKSNHKSHFNFKMKFKAKCATGIKQFQPSHANANTQHIQLRYDTIRDAILTCAPKPT